MARYGEPDTVMLYIRVPRKIHRELVDLAAAEDRPIAKVGARILAAGLAAEVAKHKGSGRPRTTPAP